MVIRMVTGSRRRIMSVDGAPSTSDGNVSAPGDRVRPVTAVTAFIWHSLYTTHHELADYTARHGRSGAAHSHARSSATPERTAAIRLQRASARRVEKKFTHLCRITSIRLLSTEGMTLTSFCAAPKVWNINAHAKSVHVRSSTQSYLAVE